MNLLFCISYSSFQVSVSLFYKSYKLLRRGSLKINSILFKVLVECYFYLAVIVFLSTVIVKFLKFRFLRQYSVAYTRLLPNSVIFGKLYLKLNKCLAPYTSLKLPPSLSCLKSKYIIIGNSSSFLLSFLLSFLPLKPLLQLSTQQYINGKY